MRAELIERQIMFLYIAYTLWMYLVHMNACEYTTLPTVPTLRSVFNAQKNDLLHHYWDIIAVHLNKGQAYRD